jgi:hypothetical protein
VAQRRRRAGTHSPTNAEVRLPSWGGTRSGYRMAQLRLQRASTSQSQHERQKTTGPGGYR